MQGLFIIVIITVILLQCYIQRGYFLMLNSHLRICSMEYRSWQRTLSGQVIFLFPLEARLCSLLSLLLWRTNSKTRSTKVKIENWGDKWGSCRLLRVIFLGAAVGVGFPKVGIHWCLSGYSSPVSVTYTCRGFEVDCGLWFIPTCNFHFLCFFEILFY